MKYKVYYLFSNYDIILCQQARKVIVVNISYKKLWKLLIDKDMNKNDLREAIGVSSATIARMSKGVPVSTEVMMKICKALNCNWGDIADVVNDEGVEVNQIDRG